MRTPPDTLYSTTNRSESPLVSFLTGVLVRLWTLGLVSSVLLAGTCILYVSVFGNTAKYFLVRYGFDKSNNTKKIIPEGSKLGRKDVWVIQQREEGRRKGESNRVRGSCRLLLCHTNPDGAFVFFVAADPWEKNRKRKKFNIKQQRVKCGRKRD